MKFGKTFEKQMVPEWIEAYMDYNGLKRIQQEISRNRQRSQIGMPLRVLQHTETLQCSFSGLLYEPTHGQNVGDIEDQVINVDTVQKDASRKFYQTNFLRKSEEGGGIELNFFKKLDEELNEVNIFDRDKVDEVVHEAALLNKQMHALVALRINVQKFDVSDLNLEKHISESVTPATPEGTTRKPGSANADTVHGTSDFNLEKHISDSVTTATPESTTRNAGTANASTIQDIDRTDISEEEACDIVAENVPLSHGDGNEGNNDRDDKQDHIGILLRVIIKNELETPISTLKAVFSDYKDGEKCTRKD